MKNKLWVHIIFLVVMFCHPSNGQKLSTIRYGVNSSLQTNTVYDIYFSSQNMLYIATDNGLWSYNGLGFQNYFPENGEILEVSNIQEDDNGTIYCQDFNSNIYYLQEDVLKKKKIPPVAKSFYNYTIDSSYFYYKTASKIVVESHQTGTYQYLNFDTKLVQSISKNLYFIAGEKGTNNYFIYQTNKDLSLKKIKITQYKNHRLLKDYGEAWCDYQGKDSIITASGELLLDLSKTSFQLRPYRFVKTQKQLFAACEEGLYDIKQNKLYLKDHFITQVLNDNEGNIWVSTLDNGLHKISNMSNIYYPIGEGQYRSDFILKDQDRIIYSDESGNLYTLNEGSTKPGELFYKSKKKSLVKSIHINSHNHIISSSWQYNIHNEHLDLLYSSMSYGEIYPTSNSFNVYQKRDNNSIVLNINPFEVRHRYEIKFASTLEQNIIESTENKGFTFYRYEDSIKRIRTSLDSMNLGFVLWKENVYSILNHTLYKINPHNNSVKRLRYLPHAKKVFFENQRYWILTDSLIFELNQNGQTINQIERKNTLKQHITNISISKKHISFCTKRAVFLYDAQTLEYLCQFTPQNGIISRDFDRARIYDDALYINGSKGITKFSLDSPFNFGKPHLSISTVLVNSEKTTQNSFSYSQNNISLLFHLRSFTASGKLYWRLNEKDWKKLEGKPIINLEELQSGDYSIEAYFESDLGVKTKTINYQFHIDLPYWRKWWFILIIGLILASILGLIYRNRIQQINKQNQLQNDLITSQMTALKSQMNPHFIFNALNSIQSLIRFNKNKEAYKYVNTFAILLRQTLNYSDKDFIPLENEIELLTNYLEMENMRLDGLLNYNISTLDSDNVQIPSMIIQPFVENSIKHGLLHKKTGSKEVSISFERKNNILWCTIIDNGIGREKAKAIQKKRNQASFSTGATQKRLKLLQELQHAELGIKYEDLVDANHNPLGTKVVIKIPIETYD